MQMSDPDGGMFRSLLWLAKDWAGTEQVPFDEGYKSCDNCAFYSAKGFGYYADPSMTHGKCFRSGESSEPTVSIGYCGQWKTWKN
jgi:hypothetical protein